MKDQPPKTMFKSFVHEKKTKAAKEISRALFWFSLLIFLAIVLSMGFLI
jgi:hypothetical protein